MSFMSGFAAAVAWRRSCFSRSVTAISVSFILVVPLIRLVDGVIAVLLLMAFSRSIVNIYFVVQRACLLSSLALLLQLFIFLRSMPFSGARSRAAQQPARRLFFG